MVLSSTVLFQRLGGSKRQSGLEAITITLANVGPDLINRSTCWVGCSEGGRRVQYVFDGFVLGHAIAESFVHGFDHGVASVNPLTKESCILKPHVIGLRVDSPMVSLLY